jgi:hypothetical protein
MENERITYLLTIRAEPGVDAVRSLRALLKAMLRTYGLRCVKLQEDKQQGRMTMDMRDYTEKHIKVDQVRDAPIQAHIINVFESERFARPVLELDNGSDFLLNEGNTSVLIRAFGHDSSAWHGKEIVLELGTYKDWKTNPPEEKQTVKVRAVSPAKTAVGNSGAPSKPPLPPSRTAAARKDDFDDSIPFSASGEG